MPTLSALFEEPLNLHATTKAEAELIKTRDTDEQDLPPTEESRKRKGNLELIPVRHMRSNPRSYSLTYAANYDTNYLSPAHHPRTVPVAHRSLSIKVFELPTRLHSGSPFAMSPLETSRRFGGESLLYYPPA
jgi:hypothetical protein